MTSEITEITGSGGGKKGSGKSADNTLRSNATVRFVEAISEGPILGIVKGRQSLYFDETPVKNADGTLNFKGVGFVQRKGYPDDEHMQGHSGVESVTSVDIEVEKVIGPVVRTITEPDADAVRVIVRIDSLFKIDSKGQATTSSLSYKIQMRPFAGIWEDVVVQDLVDEKCTSPVQLAHKFSLPVGGHPWDVRVVRETDDSVSDKDSSVMTFESYVTLIEGRFTYPHTATAGIKVRAESLGQSIPERAYKVMGRIISVPSNYDPVARTYSGIWDGLFVEKWTNNPAWIFYDLLINSRYGLGDHISETEVSSLKWKLYTIGQYCDQLIPSGFKDDGGADIMEPRFSFNGVIRNRSEAYNVLQSITTAFRGMGYWALGQVMASADMPSDPVKLVTAANVIGGRFNYSSTALKARHSVAIVRWNNPNDFYRSDTELVINEEALKKYGWREKRVDLAGCTSRGLAHRYGEWTLDVENTETETVQYKASFDHLDISVGDIVAISDPRKATVRMGGRIELHERGINVTRDRITLDDLVPFIDGESYKIWLTKQDGNLEEIDIQSASAASKEIEINSVGFQIDPNSIFLITGTDLVPKQYRILTVGEPEDNVFQITALFHDPTKYDRIEKGLEFKPIPYKREGFSKSPTNLVVIQTPYVDDDGFTRVRIRLDWTAPIGVIVREYVIQADTPKETRRVLGTTERPYFELEGMERGDYTFYVTTFDRQGRASNPISVQSTISGVDGISTGVVDSLSLVENPGSGEFLGKDVRFSWRNLFPSAFGEPADKENPTIYDFNEIKVYHGPTSTLLRTEILRGNSYTYSYDNNFQDCEDSSLTIGAARNLRFEVSVTSRTGSKSAEATLVAVNSPPAAVVPTISNQAQTITVSLPPTQASDIRGMKVWIESTTGFDPEVEAPIFDGSAAFVTWTGTPGATYYIRAGYYDFFDDAVVVSAESSIVLPAFAALIDPSVPTGLSLTTSDAGNGLSRVTAVWDENVEVDLIGYDILVKENSGGEVSFLSATATKFWDVLPGTIVTTRVRARVSTGARSDYSASVNITALTDTAPPAVPENLTVIGSFEGFWLDWDKNTEIDFKHYEIYRSEISTNPLVSTPPSITTTSNQFYDGGVTGVLTRYYWIRGVDTSGNKSAWSDVQSGDSISADISVTQEDIQGLVDETSFANGITAPIIVSTLPTVDNFEGRTAVLVTDGKLYRYHNESWTNSLDFGDLEGEIGSNQIGADVVTAGAIAAGAVTAEQIAANAVTASKVLIGSSDNLNLDSDFADLDAWTGGTTISLQSVDDSIQHQWGSSNLIRIDGDPNSYIVSQSVFNFDIDPLGEELYMRWAGDIVAGSGFIYVQVMFSNNINFTNPIYRNVGVSLNTFYTVKEGRIVVPAGYKYAKLQLVKGNTGVSTCWFGGLSVRRINAGKLIVDGAITANKLSAGEIITSSAQIKDAIITNGKIANASINNAKIQDATITSAKIVDIEASKVTISGSTKLSNWQKGGDVTKIDGGEVSANTISANKLVIGSRGVSLHNVNFSTSGDNVLWTSGEVRFIDNSGNYGYRSITAGSINFTGSVIHIYWQYPNSTLSTTTVPADALVVDNRIIVASYSGGSNLTNFRSRTIIDGNFISTGAIDTVHMRANSITAAQIATQTITSNEIQSNAIETRHISTNTITAGMIQTNAVGSDALISNSVTASQLTTNSVTNVKIAGNAITASKVAANAIVAGKIAADAITTRELAANSVTASEANFTTLSALNLNVVNADIDNLAVSNSKIGNNSVSVSDYSIKTTNQVVGSIGSWGLYHQDTVNPINTSRMHIWCGVRFIFSDSAGTPDHRWRIRILVDGVALSGSGIEGDGVIYSISKGQRNVVGGNRVIRLEIQCGANVTVDFGDIQVISISK